MIFCVIQVESDNSRHRDKAQRLARDSQLTAILVLQNSSNGPERITDANERIVGISFSSPLPVNQHRPKLHSDAIELSKADLHSLGVYVIHVGD